MGQKPSKTATATSTEKEKTVPMDSLSDEELLKRLARSFELNRDYELSQLEKRTGKKHTLRDISNLGVKDVYSNEYIRRNHLGDHENLWFCDSRGLFTIADTYGRPYTIRYGGCGYISIDFVRTPQPKGEKEESESKESGEIVS